METAIFVQNCSAALNRLSLSAKQAIAAFEQLSAPRVLWLPRIGGEWPDRFTLLNRYLRTDHEPEYFTDERAVLT